jgi:hypothetical protein
VVEGKIKNMTYFIIGIVSSIIFTILVVKINLELFESNEDLLFLSIFSIFVIFLWPIIITLFFFYLIGFLTRKIIERKKEK